MSPKKALPKREKKGAPTSCQKAFALRAEAGASRQKRREGTYHLREKGLVRLSGIFDGRRGHGSKPVLVICRAKGGGRAKVQF